MASPLRWCLVLFVLLFASRATASATDRGTESRFTRALAERRQRLATEGRRPQAVVPLLGALSELWPLLDDRAPLVRLFEEAASGSGAAPLVRAVASWQRSLLLDHLGSFEEAAGERQALGLITQFWVAGPFDNEGRAGHAAIYGPETALTGALDLEAQWKGKERLVGWRLAPAIATQGALPLDALLRPDQNATAYLTTVVKSPQATAAALHLGSSGAVKVWVNGALVLDRDVYRPLRFDQDAAPCRLVAGENRVTFKLSTLDGVWALIARFTAVDGSALAGLTISTELGDFAKCRAQPAAARFVVEELGHLLRLETERQPQSAAAWSDLGQYLYHVAPDPPEEHRARLALRRAAELAPSPAAYRWLARAEEDENERRQALSTGLTLVPTAPGGAVDDEAVALHEALGQLHAQARRERQAETAWRAGLERDQGDWPLRLHLADLDADRGLPAQAAATLAALAQRHSAPRLLRARAQLAVQRGQRREAQALYRQLVEIEHDDLDALRELFTLLRAEGATGEALGLLDRIARTRPDVLQVDLDRAELLEAAGRCEEAHQALLAALRIAPEESRLLERDGRLLHRLGRDAEALPRLKEALALRPQNPELRAYLQHLEASDKGADLPHRYALDALALKARASRPSGAGDAARVLYDQAVTRVHANGLSETFHQRVTELLDERALREQAEVDIRYTPETQSVELRTARIYKRSGEVVEANVAAERDVSEPWYGLYYDVKAEVITFEGLQVGDVIDLQYVINDTGRRNLFADYFGDLHLLQDDLPRLATRYLVIAPKERPLHFNRPRLAGLEQGQRREGDDTVYFFEAKDVPKIDAEPGMPGYTEVAAYVHISTYGSWEEVARWYRGLVADQLQTNAAIHDAVAAAVRGRGDERARVQAVYELVVKKTRYVGLEFGIHGFQPYRTTQVFARKFGDCKDKASLLVVMLREIGVDASLVLARTRRRGDIDTAPASLAPFDHAIVYVPKYDLFLDGTAEFSGAGELPSDDQDIPVLVVNEGRLRRTPILPAQTNEVRTTQQIALDEHGGAHLEEEVTVAGQLAHQWRSHYQSPDEQKERYGRAWSEKHPGAALQTVSMPHLEELGRPVEVQARVGASDWARVDGGDLVVPVLGREPSMLRSYARLSQRRFDLLLGFPWRQIDHLTMVAPAGYHVARLPEARRIDSPFGSFVLAIRERKGRAPAAVEVDATLEVGRHRIARDDYPAFRRFCADVDAAVGQELLFSR